MKKGLILLTLCLPIWVTATHLRYGYISARRLDPFNLQTEIKLTVYTNTGSAILFGGDEDVLDLGDGNFILIPETPAISRPDLGPGIGMATFTFVHTYASPGVYSISYSEANLLEGIINVNNSANTPLTLETLIVIDPFNDFKSTGELLAEPYMLAKGGVPLSLSVARANTDELFFSYSIPVNTFPLLRIPENFSINTHNGLITWDSQFQNQVTLGAYLFPVYTRIFRKVSDQPVMVASVLHYVQITLTDDPFTGTISDKANLDENNRVYVPASEARTIKLLFETTGSPTGIALNVHTDLTDHPNNVLSFSTYDSLGGSIKIGLLTLTHHPAIERDLPYVINVRGSYTNSGLYGHDINYLFYTRDLYPPEIITGIKETENDLSGIELYPNPVTDFLKFNGTTQSPARILITDVNGKILINNRILHLPGVLDVRPLLPGVYLAIIQTSHSRKIWRFVKN
ncbi:MAG: T9SS type A sorting domain-containing protein [Cyclobacteriaceae bacterium]|nr:T9SS type A sorting domain-containing protein [Cyclobacteriaceae bacterium]